MIRRLKHEVRSLIRSGVAITSFTQCVEELILNSLDAESTCIAIRVNIQAGNIKVVDNGTGMNKENLSIIGERYSTSKCHSLKDLENLTCFGYRGEALSSIKEICSTLEIESNASGLPTYLCSFCKGKASVVCSSAARPTVGTTVTVKDLFYRLPVRQRQLKVAVEMDRLLQRIKTIALVHPKVSFSVRNDQNGTLILKTKKTTSIFESFRSLYGSELSENFKCLKYQHDNVKVRGYVSTATHTTKNFQFVYINERNVLKTKIHKIINNLLSNSSLMKTRHTGLKNPEAENSPERKPNNHGIFLVGIYCPYSEYDVTFDPCKTLVEFNDWKSVIACIEMALMKFFKDNGFVMTDPPELEPMFQSTNKLEPGEGRQENNQSSNKKPYQFVDGDTIYGKGIHISDKTNALSSLTALKQCAKHTRSTGCDEAMNKQGDFNVNVSEVNHAPILGTPDSVPGRILTQAKDASICPLRLKSAANPIAKTKSHYHNLRKFHKHSNPAQSNKAANIRYDMKKTDTTESELSKCWEKRQSPTLNQMLRFSVKLGNNDEIPDPGVKRRDKTFIPLDTCEGIYPSSLSQFRKEYMQSHKDMQGPTDMVENVPNLMTALKHKNTNSTKVIDKDVHEEMENMFREVPFKDHLKQAKKSNNVDDLFRTKYVSMHHPNSPNETNKTFMSPKQVPCHLSQLKTYANDRSANPQDERGYLSQYKPPNFFFQEPKNISQGPLPNAGEFLVPFQFSPKRKLEIPKGLSQTKVHVCAMPGETLNDMAHMFMPSKIAPLNGNPASHLPGTEIFSQMDCDHNFNFLSVPLDSGDIYGEKENSSPVIQSKNWNRFCSSEDSSPPQYSADWNENFHKQRIIHGNCVQSKQPRSSHMWELPETQAKSSITSAKVDDLLQPHTSMTLEDLPHTMNCGEGDSWPRFYDGSYDKYGCVGNPFIDVQVPSQPSETISSAFGLEHCQPVLDNECQEAPTDYNNISQNYATTIKEKQGKTPAVADACVQTTLTQAVHLNDSTKSMGNLTTEASIPKNHGPLHQIELAALGLETRREPEMFDIWIDNEFNVPSNVKNIPRKSAETNTLMTTTSEYDIELEPLSYDDSLSLNVVREQSVSLNYKSPGQLCNLVSEVKSTPNNMQENSQHSNLDGEGVTETQTFFQGTQSFSITGDIQNVPPSPDPGHSSREPVKETQVTALSEACQSEYKSQENGSPSGITICNQEQPDLKVAACTKSKLGQGNGCKESMVSLETRPKGRWMSQLDLLTGKTIYLDLTKGDTSAMQPSGLTELPSNSPINQEATGSNMKKQNCVTHHCQVQHQSSEGAQSNGVNQPVPPNPTSTISGSQDLLKEPSVGDLSKWKKETITEAIGKESTLDAALMIEKFMRERKEKRTIMLKDPLNIEVSRGTKLSKSVHGITGQIKFTKEMLQNIEVVGQLDSKFILCLMNCAVNPNQPTSVTLVVIDQHAAHERVRLEKFMKEIHDGLYIKSVRLTNPMELQLNNSDQGFITCHQEQFKKIGLQINFAADTNRLSVSTVPACLVDEENMMKKKVTVAIDKELLKEMIIHHLELLKNTHGASGTTIPLPILKQLASKACHGAIKFGDPLKQLECEELIRDLAKCDLPFQCAHGRPSIIPLLDIDKLENVRNQMLYRKPNLKKLTSQLQQKK